MNVSHKRSHDTLGPEDFPDGLHMRHIPESRDSDSYNVSSGRRHCTALRHSVFNIESMRVAHCLDCDGAAFSDSNATDLSLNFPCHCKLMLLLLF